MADFQALCREFAGVTEEDTIMEDQIGSKKYSRKRGRSTTAKPDGASLEGRALSSHLWLRPRRSVALQMGEPTTVESAET